jgi:hypothetical protein
MFARVTTFKGAPGRTASPELQERAIATIQKEPGFKGIYALSDPETGELLAVSFWETAEQAKTPGEAVARGRAEAAAALGATTAPTAKIYEVTAQG